MPAGSEGATVLFRLAAGLSLQQVGGNNEALYLGSPFIDLGDLGVTEETLHRILLHVTVAAVDLNGIDRGVDGCLRSEELRHGGMLAVALALVLRECGALGQES